MNRENNGRGNESAFEISLPLFDKRPARHENLSDAAPPQAFNLKSTRRAAACGSAAGVAATRLDIIIDHPSSTAITCANNGSESNVSKYYRRRRRGLRSLLKHQASRAREPSRGAALLI